LIARVCTKRTPAIKTKISHDHGDGDFSNIAVHRELHRYSSPYPTPPSSGILPDDFNGTIRSIEKRYGQNLYRICSQKNYWIYSPIIWFFSKRTRPLLDTKKAGHEFYICFFSLVLASYLYEEKR
jgi:hypothetical protein